MLQECQAWEQPLDWKKKCGMDLTCYDSVLLGCQAWREAYKARLAAWSSDLCTIDKIKEAIELEKKKFEQKCRYEDELLVSDVCMPSMSMQSVPCISSPAAEVCVQPEHLYALAPDIETRQNTPMTSVKCKLKHCLKKEMCT